MYRTTRTFTSSKRHSKPESCRSLATTQASHRKALRTPFLRLVGPVRRRRVALVVGPRQRRRRNHRVGVRRTTATRTAPPPAVMMMRSSARRTSAPVASSQAPQRPASERPLLRGASRACRRMVLLWRGGVRAACRRCDGKGAHRPGRGGRAPRIPQRRRGPDVWRRREGVCQEESEEEH